MFPLSMNHEIFHLNMDLIVPYILRRLDPVLSLQLVAVVGEADGDHHDDDDGH